VLLIALMGATAFADEGSPLISESAYNLRPTQAIAGMAAVKEKEKKLGKFSKTERVAYLKMRPVPVVIGPGGFYYMVDHHHMSLALIKSGHKSLFVKVIADWSDLSTDIFWEKMKASHYTYLKDGEGLEITPADLPVEVTSLRDDPYRSLAYYAREGGAFENINTPFVEFAWADFYRKAFTLDDLKKDWNRSVKKAIKLSQKREAMGLPGFNAVLTCDQVFGD
jgi:hypothetical protein